MTKSIGIESIGQIAIAVRDIKASTDFYRDVLGLQFLFEAPPGLAFFDCGGVRLMLTIPQGDEGDHKTSVIYYKVGDIEAATAELKARGVSFVRDPRN